MANTHRAPKQWCLCKTETVTTFENWRQNLQYTLSLDTNFAPFLVEGATWEKRTRANPLRGFENDGEGVDEAIRKTAQQKVTFLELMLGQIANYCPVISRNTLVKNSTSVSSIWQAIRMHYGFQATGAHFLDFADIKLEPEERPEDLFQRLMAFVEDNLLRRNGGITHHAEDPGEDEELSPSLENFIVLMWLHLLHRDLPRLVKQRYGTELRSRTLASIKPEISQALDSLLDELATVSEAKIMRSVTPGSRSLARESRYRSNPQPRRATKCCPLCKQAGRAEYNHFLSRCTYLPEGDRKFLTKARQVECIDEDIETGHQEEHVYDDNEHLRENTPGHFSARRVQVRPSPYINTFCGPHTLCITLDSGATTNMIRESIALSLGVSIAKSSQVAVQADGVSPLHVVGETVIKLTRDNNTFTLEALVVKDLDVDALGGVPFLDRNDISVRTSKRHVILSDGTVYQYGRKGSEAVTVRRTQAVVLRAPSKVTTVWPGEFVELQLPQDMEEDIPLALEPRLDGSSRKRMYTPWPKPAIMESVGHKVRVTNTTTEPQVLSKHEHFCQVSQVFSPVRPCDAHDVTDGAVKPPDHLDARKGVVYSHEIRLDPDNLLPDNTRSQFRKLHTEYEEVFSPKFGTYNGAHGPFEAIVNMGPVLPPQRKGRVPQYAKDKLVELQSKFDELEALGVFKRPEEVGVVVEYLNPSFLVKKSNGGFRLVTAFTEVGRYSKPQPSLMPDVDSTLRSIAQWKYIIATDLTSAFYQIPLARSSMKYCGVVTPFRGVRVYTRSAMGMPGSEKALEELMCRVLGDLLVEGVVAKIADDLYCGGNSPDSLLHNWKRVLQALNHCGLHLSAKKTIIAPAETMVLGWIWASGSIRASPHRIATLCSCSIPDTVRGLRSFIGAYKVLARVIPNCANIIAPLDQLAAGKQSNDKLSWSEDTQLAFKNAQEFLTSNKSIVLPHPDDTLWIITDGALRKPGIGATLYTMRNGKPLLAGFFSAKLRQNQSTWLPCEIEALSISAAVKHFSPYIVQSRTNACVLTDSKPCVQAYEKLSRGEYSASPRISTFLATVSRYQISIRHLAGKANVPSDFASRNAAECSDEKCQICSFIARTEESVVRSVSIQDILAGNVRIPYTSRAAWLETQAECADLRRTHAHLAQGTRPSKKITGIKDVKRYLRCVSIARDGLLVVHKTEPLAATRDCIVIPRNVLHGLLAALHVKLDHPSQHQLKAVFQRHFFALDVDQAIATVTKSCHCCASLQQIPHTIQDQTSSDPPEVIGITFAADILKRERQLVFVLRETVTAYTVACLVESEKHTSLREAIIRLCVELRPLDGPPASVRTDCAPGFAALVNDDLLKRYRINLELGRTKNQNKNPVAERAIQELEVELLKQEPGGGPVSPLSLAIAVARLNSRLRSRGLSARELWTQRDQFTHTQISVTDHDIIQAQHKDRLKNHPHSEKAKAPTGVLPVRPEIQVGELVYLHSDRSKARGRDRYLVVSVDGGWCNIRKFTGNQLRKASYRVKRDECYTVPNETVTHTKLPQVGCDESSDEEECIQEHNQAPEPPKPPDIPELLAEVPDDSAPNIPQPMEYSHDNSLSENTMGSNVSDTKGVCEDIGQTPVSSKSDLRRSARQRKTPRHLQEYVL